MVLICGIRTHVHPTATAFHLWIARFYQICAPVLAVVTVQQFPLFSFFFPFFFLPRLTAPLLCSNRSQGCPDREPTRAHRTLPVTHRFASLTLMVAKAGQPAPIERLTNFVVTAVKADQAERQSALIERFTRRTASPFVETAVKADLAESQSALIERSL